MTAPDTRSALPLWAKRLAGCIYPVGIIVVITISGSLGLFIIPWRMGWPGWAGGVVGVPLMYLSVWAFRGIAIRLGGKRLDRLAKEAVEDEASQVIGRLLSRAQQTADATYIERAESALRKAQRRLGTAEACEDLAERIAEARRHTKSAARSE